MKKMFWYVGLCFMVSLLVVPSVNAGWEDMEVLKYDFVIDSNEPRHQWYPWIAYNSVDDEFMLLWHTSGPLRNDCDPGDDYECTGAFHSTDGRRVSTDGGLLGELIQLAGPDEGYINGSRLAYNKFTNEYMTVTPIAPTPISFDVELLIARINNVGDIQYGLTPIYPGGGSESMIPIVVFNPLRREYLVAYSDRNIYNAHLNLVGFILNEDGTSRVGPFPIGNQLGDYYAPRVAYNPNEDTYLVVWEDMRNVVDWADPIDIYGALLDSDGNMIVEIAVIDDHDIPEPDAGDQRVPVPVYNPDKDEFLVIWEVDEQPWVDDSAIKGRFLNPDGSIKGEIFTIVDEPRQQHWPDIQYIAEYQKYFMVWNDCRNDGQPAGTDWWVSPAMDVYARWLDDTGSPIGDEILIAEREGAGENWKQIPLIAYSPVAKRFLIPWYDRRASGNTAFGEAPSDVKATLYGIPPSLRVRVVEEGTGNPLEGAWTLVLGPSLVAFEKTNGEGECWFDIEADSQSAGTYLVMVFKLGCTMAIKFVNYADSPLQETVEVVKLW